MTLTRAQVYDINVAIRALDQFQGKEMSKHFLLEIYNIETAISSEMQNIERVFRPSDSYKEFELKRSELIRQYAVIKPDGNYSIVGNQIEIKEGSVEKFKSEVQILVDSYSDAIKDYKKSMTDFDELMKTTTDIKINKIDFKIIPEYLTKQIFDWLKPVIKFPESD